MGTTKPKRLAVRLSAALLLVAAAVALYAYPRRQVPEMLRIVPRDGLAACLRVRGLGPVWRRCALSEFGRKVGKGAIFPINEMIAEDEGYRDDWEDLDTTYWPEVFGRDCVLGIYAGEEGKSLRAAVWARVGFRARLFHLWERMRGAVCFWNPQVRVRRVGGLAVVSVMDRRRGTEDFSYALLGDLGIATTGRGDGFWERVASLAAGRAAAGTHAKGLCAEVPVPEEGKARGAFFADVGALRRHADARLRAIARVSPETGRTLGAVWGPAREATEGWGIARASFTLGTQAAAEVRIESSGAGERPKPLAGEPLERVMARRGILYAAGGWEPRGLLARARRAWPRGQVRFEGRGGVTAFSAKHFSLDWLGGEWAFLLYLDGRGMLNAAVSLPVTDRRVARVRLTRFLKLANGARINFRDGRGGGWAPLGDPLDIEAVRGGYRIGPGAPLEYLYNPTLLLQGDRLLIGSADPRESDVPGAARPTAEGKGGSVTGRLVLKGSDAERAASSLRQVLAIAGAFVDAGPDRERIEAARRALGALEWLAPLRELRALVSAEKGGTRVSLAAEIGDIPGR